MDAVSYLQRRSQIEVYFDRTAAEAWRRLTSDAPVGRIRRTVRAGRDEMRRTLLGWLPDDLAGRHVLDAGCGTGAFSVEAARRGATVVAVDVSPTLVELGRERLPAKVGDGTVTFAVGDMLAPELGEFDHVVAMDSLIHYGTRDVLAALEKLAARTRTSIIFTFAPKTPLLALMHMVGRLFPRANRAPAIEPVTHARMLRLLRRSPALSGWTVGRTHRVAGGFYISHAVELTRS